MSKPPREFWIEIDPFLRRTVHVRKPEMIELYNNLCHVREVLPDQPEDLARGILKAVEMLEEYANSGVYNSLRIPAECMADWLRAEAIEKGWMKE